MDRYVREVTALAVFKSSVSGSWRVRLAILVLTMPLSALGVAAVLVETEDTSTASASVSTLDAQNVNAADSNNDNIPNIVVVGIRPRTADQQVDVKRHLLAPAVDGAELLRNVNGVTLGRFGGRGLEPFIRGQSQSQLKVLLDGSEVHGACPNRMDPPASYASVNNFDQITILKGVQTLRYGATGGAVIFERDLRPQKSGFSGQGQIAASNNALTYDFAAELSYGGEGFYANLGMDKRSADNYRDGRGDTVRSSWTESATHMSAGVVLRTDDRLELSYENSETRDAYYAGAGMDSPVDEAVHWRVKYQAYDFAAVANMEANLYAVDVNHLMDNYSNRPFSAAMAMRVPSRSDVRGMRFMTAFNRWHGMDWQVGADAKWQGSQATRYMGASVDTVTTVNAYLWPDIEQRQWALWSEFDYSWRANASLRAGLRYDHERAEVKQALLDPPASMLFSAHELYGRYYGASAFADAPADRAGLSALLRYEYTVDDQWRWFVGVSRTQRFASRNERYLAMNNNMTAMRWVGNPGLDDEQHRQLDTGLIWNTDKQQLQIALYHDRIDHYILRDRAHGQAGILLADNATIYRNVDASLQGAEIQGGQWLSHHWYLELAAAYTEGENISDGRALAQISPLSGRLSLAFEKAAFSANMSLRSAATQTRVDDDMTVGSGLDAGQTPGWSTFNVSFGYQFAAAGKIHTGVDNLFNKTYAEHLNRANQDPFNPVSVQVNEPGRVVWVKYSQEF